MKRIVKEKPMKRISLKQLHNIHKKIHDMRLDTSVDGEMFLSFLDAYKQLKKGDTMNVYLSTGGGECTYMGNIIYLLRNLKNRGVKVVMINTGSINSAGVDIYMEGQIRTAFPSSTFMMHRERIELDKDTPLQVPELENYIDILTAEEKDYPLPPRKVKLNADQKRVLDNGLDLTLGVDAAMRAKIMTHIMVLD